MEYIKRNYPAEFRAEGESGLIVGVPIVYDTPTDIGGYFQETICKGEWQRLSSNMENKH